MYLDYAEDLLKHFVQCFAILYDVHNVTHNVHGLMHLSNDVRTYGPLDNFSSLKCENYMQVLKRMIKKPDKPLQRIYNRYRS